MRWYKHMTDSWTDEKLARMTVDDGLEIYGFYWRVLEIVAKQMDKTTKTNCAYSDKVWSKFCGISAKKFRKFADKLDKLNLIILENSDGRIDIDIPNLVKFRDEYTSRSD